MSAVMLKTVVNSRYSHCVLLYSRSDVSGCFIFYFLKMIQNTLMLEGVNNWLQKNDQSSNPKLGTMSVTYIQLQGGFVGFQGGLCGLSGGTTVQI